MAELRSVDPRTLKPNPNNPRIVPVPKERDQQLAASSAAIGLLQPPLVREIDGEPVVRAGDRRARAAIAAGKEVIDVYVLTAGKDIAASERPTPGTVPGSSLRNEQRRHGPCPVI